MRRRLDAWRASLVDEGEGEGEGETSHRRRLFVLEDAADLIIQESRSNHYDKIGKLLNMTDGLFGQGREDVFLVTFNEEVERVDPAFLRPGRCIGQVRFMEFGAEEASDWFRAHGVKCEAGGELTIAEMYARMLEGEGASGHAAKKTGPIGFHRGSQ